MLRSATKRAGKWSNIACQVSLSPIPSLSIGLCNDRANVLNRQRVSQFVSTPLNSSVLSTRSLTSLCSPAATSPTSSISCFSTFSSAAINIHRGHPPPSRSSEIIASNPHVTSLSTLVRIIKRHNSTFTHNEHGSSRPTWLGAPTKERSPFPQVDLRHPLVLYNLSNLRIFRFYGYVPLLLAVLGLGVFVKIIISPELHQPILLGVCGGIVIAMTGIALWTRYIFRRLIHRITLLPRNRIEIKTVGMVSTGPTYLYPIEGIIPAYTGAPSLDRQYHRIRVLERPEDPTSPVRTFFIIPPKRGAGMAMDPLLDELLLANTIRSEGRKDTMVIVEEAELKRRVDW